MRFRALSTRKTTFNKLRCFRQSAWEYPRGITRGDCRSIVCCEYSTGSGIDRKNQRMCEVERVADWILILFRWLIAMPHRAARVLATGLAVVADMAAVRSAAAEGGWRRFERGSFARAAIVRIGPHLRSIGWMTYCLGRGWASAPPGLLPALAARAPGRLNLRLVVRGVPRFIPDDHFLSCSECVPGYKAPALGAGCHSTDFSMLAYAAEC